MQHAWCMQRRRLSPRSKGTDIGALYVFPIAACDMETSARLYNLICQSSSWKCTIVCNCKWNCCAGSQRGSAETKPPCLGGGAPATTSARPCTTPTKMSASCSPRLLYSDWDAQRQASLFLPAKHLLAHFWASHGSGEAPDADQYTVLALFP